MSTTRTRLRRLVPAFVAIPLLAGLLVGANMAVASPVTASKVASDYKFGGMPIAMVPRGLERSAITSEAARVTVSRTPPA